MNSKKIQVGEVYQVKHNKGKDYDFDQRHPAHDGPALILEVSWVHGAFSGKKRPDGTIPKQQRRRGIVRYMDRSGQEWIVGAESVKKPWKDERTANGLRKTHERKQQERQAALPFPPVGPAPVTPMIAEAQARDAYDSRRVLERLRKKENEIDTRLESLRSQLEPLEREHTQLCATILTLEQVLAEYAHG